MDGANASEARLQRAIDGAKFSAVEIMGFKANHNLGLLAGAAIGFRVASVEYGEIIKRLEAEVEKAALALAGNRQQGRG